MDTLGITPLLPSAGGYCRLGTTIVGGFVFTSANESIRAETLHTARVYAKTLHNDSTKS